jgi:hypothetical protein
MTEAWHAREARQQGFIHGLAEEVRDAADESGNYERLVIDFLITILEHFRTKTGAEPVAGSDADRLFTTMERRIVEFSRVESERLALIYRLFSELEKSIASWTGRAYLRDQIAKPEEVFGAPAMSEVKGD